MRKIFTVLTALFLSGCMGIVNDMNNNKFMETEANPLPSELVGYWTGTSGPYLWSFKLSPDGNGVSCYAYQGKEVVDKIKFTGKSFIVQDGLQLDVLSYDANKLVIKPPYFGASSSNFYRDDDKGQMATFCQKNI